jgi:hypothetical protein
MKKTILILMALATIIASFIKYEEGPAVGATQKNYA